MGLKVTEVNNVVIQKLKERDASFVALQKGVLASTNGCAVS